MLMSGLKTYRILFFSLVGALTLFHLWYIGADFLDLAPDEAHYWEWSRRLDWSYYSKGPLVAYLIALSTRMGKNTEFFVRFPTVVISILMSFVTFYLARDMFRSDRAGFYSTLLLSLIPLYAAGAILMTIDPPFVLFWALTIFFFYKVLTTGKSLWWYPAGISLGFGLLSKYTMALLPFLILLYLVISPKDRPWLRRKEPYLAILLASLLFSPVIIWNALHNWVSLRHVLGQAGAGRGFQVSIKTFSQFLASQAGVVTPLIFLALILAIIRSGHLGIRERRRGHLLLFCTSAPVLVFFLLLSLYTKVQANWAAPAYFTGTLAAVAWGENLYQQNPRSAKKGIINTFLTFAISVALLTNAAGHFPSLLPMAGIDLPPKMDPTRRLQGWRELGLEVSRLIEGMEKGAQPFILSDAYQISSELAFYVKGHPWTYNANLGRRMNQYDFWEDFSSFKGRDAIYVTWGEGELHPDIKKAFASIQRERVLHILRRGHIAQTFSIYKGQNFQGMEKGEFQRF